MTESKTDQAAQRAAYNAATTTLRNAHRDEFNGYMLAETAARGLEWQPRLSPQEKARQEIARLAKENGIALSFAVTTAEDAQDNVEIRQAVVAAEAEETLVDSVTVVVEEEYEAEVQAHSARISDALTSAAVQSQVTSFS